MISKYLLIFSRIYYICNLFFLDSKLLLAPFYDMYYSKITKRTNFNGE